MESKTTGFNNPGNDSATYTYYYSNYQCDSVALKRSWQQGFRTVTVIEYYADKADNRNIAFYESIVLPPVFTGYFGKPVNSKAIKSVTSKNYSPTGVSTGIPDVFEYEYDTKGRIIKEMGKPAGATHPPITHTYDYY
jgi:hypothetical protein